MTRPTIHEKLPDCPICETDELWFWGYLDGTWRIRCYMCNFDTDQQTTVAPMTVDQHIGQLIANRRKMGSGI